MKIFMRDLPKVDDWAGHIKEIKEAEKALGVDSNQYNTLEMRTNLQELSSTAKEHAQWQRKDRLDDLDNECLTELRVTNPQKDRNTIVDAKGGLFYDSYRWILENEEYKQWLTGSENNLLWVKGDPGKGKTMLLAGIITELEKSSPESVFYFFCQATEPRLRTATNVLRGLLWSLVRTRPHMFHHVRKEYTKEGKGAFSDSNAWQTLCAILIVILEEEDLVQDCVFVIDALDECTTDRDQLLRFILRASTSYKAKWIVSSRNWFEIEKRMDGIQKKARLQLEMNAAAISDAVKKYITRKIDELDAENSYSESTREEIQNHLLANADDTFLWVSLVCDELGKPDVMPHHITTVLKSFPAGLEKLYEKMVEKINGSRDKDLCKAVLGVVVVAYRPLTLAELGSSDSMLDKLSQDTNMLSNIVRSCGSLLTIRGDIVYTVHQSVKDFLRSSQEVMGRGLAQQHYKVFLNSIQAMQKGLHRDLYAINDPGALIDGIESPESHSLNSLQYACIHWAEHFHEGFLELSELQYTSTFDLISTFCKEKYIYWLEAMSLLRCASEAVKAVQKLKIDIVSNEILEI
ncbi:hypothetical protein NW752_008419 [Fusarium irregulare]|nr:hypothetical protein NW752_008419 [Fusarium irregulare]